MSDQIPVFTGLLSVLWKSVFPFMPIYMLGRQREVQWAQKSIYLTTETRLSLIPIPQTENEKHRMAPIPTSPPATLRSSGENLNLPACITLDDSRERLVPFSPARYFATRSFHSFPFLSGCYRSFLLRFTYTHTHTYVLHNPPASQHITRSARIAPVGCPTCRPLPHPSRSLP